MTVFNPGDEVSYIGEKSGNTITAIVDGGMRDEIQVHVKDNPRAVRMIATAKLTLVKAAPVAVSTPVPTEPKTPVFRYVCLECGQKHNGHACPRCGSDEKIGNTDSDVDMSELLGGSRAERYTPGK